MSVDVIETDQHDPEIRIIRRLPLTIRFNDPLISDTCRETQITLKFINGVLENNYVLEFYQTIQKLRLIYSDELGRSWDDANRLDNGKYPISDKERDSNTRLVSIRQNAIHKKKAELKSAVVKKLGLREIPHCKHGVNTYVLDALANEAKQLEKTFKVTPNLFGNARVPMKLNLEND